MSEDHYEDEHAGGSGGGAHHPMAQRFRGYLPVVIDVEEIVNDSYRQENLSQGELTDAVIAFCERIKAAGYTPMIYANIKGFASLVDISRLTAYDKWYADYNQTPYIPYDISIWQYSESGKVNGISTNVDLNISFKTW